jgi:hypothetical protein
MASQEFEALRQSGAAISLAEAVELNVLGLAVEEPDGEVADWFRGEPVRCGNVTLWPFTVAGYMWYFRHAVRHYDTASGRSLALAFALAQGRTPDAFADLFTRKEIFRAVNRWGLRCGATLDELDSAVARVLAVREIEDKTRELSRNVDYYQLLSNAVAGSGLGFDYWARQSLNNLRDGLRAIRAQASAGALGADDVDDYRAASHAFMTAVESLRIKYAPQRPEGSVNG